MEGGLRRGCQGREGLVIAHTPPFVLTACEGATRAAAASVAAIAGAGCLLHQVALQKAWPRPASFLFLTSSCFAFYFPTRHDVCSTASLHLDGFLHFRSVASKRIKRCIWWRRRCSHVLFFTYAHTPCPLSSLFHLFEKAHAFSFGFLF